jgi:hypothetical protein
MNANVKLNLKKLYSDDIRRCQHYILQHENTHLEAMSVRLLVLINHIRIIAGDPAWEASDILNDSNGLSLESVDNSKYIYILSKLPQDSDAFLAWTKDFIPILGDSIHSNYDRIDKMLFDASISQLLSKGRIKLIWIDLAFTQTADRAIFSSIKPIFVKHGFNIYVSDQYFTLCFINFSVELSFRFDQQIFNYVFSSPQHLQLT